MQGIFFSNFVMCPNLVRLLGKLWIPVTAGQAILVIMGLEGILVLFMLCSISASFIG